MNGAAAIKDPNGGGDSWGTPIPLWEEIYDRYFHQKTDILDPCPNLARMLPGTGLGKGRDGRDYVWDREYFVNPPWSDIGPWAFMAQESRQFGIMLVPVRSDQGWFQAYGPSARIVLIGGRVNYINPATGTTQVIDKKTGKLKPGAISCPSCLLIFGSVPGVEYWTPECHRNRRSKPAPIHKENAAP